MLEFDEAFWPLKRSFLAAVPDGGLGDTLFLVFLNCYVLIGKPVLVTFMVGTPGLHSEDLTDEHLKDLGTYKLCLCVWWWDVPRHCLIVGGGGVPLPIVGGGGVPLHTVPL